MNKYLICAVIFGAVTAVLLICLILRAKKGRRTPLPLKILWVLALAAGCAGTGVTGWASVYYHASPSALKCLESGGGVTVTQTGGCWFFDGSGTENALIFYPGGKVEYTAYAPLMRRLAEQGTDCYLLEMPLNIAFLGMNKADGIISRGEYSHYYIAGHSLGGVAASGYCADFPGKADGLILLASFPTKPLDSGLDVLMVYGSCDGVLDTQRLESSLQYFPAALEKHCIDGANHAQFGDYGAQKGDGEPGISGEEQLDETAALITEMIARRG